MKFIKTLEGFYLNVAAIETLNATSNTQGDIIIVANTNHPGRYVLAICGTTENAQLWLREFFDRYKEA